MITSSAYWTSARIFFTDDLYLESYKGFLKSWRARIKSVRFTKLSNLVWLEDFENYLVFSKFIEELVFVTDSFLELEFESSYSIRFFCYGLSFCTGSLISILRFAKNLFLTFILAGGLGGLGFELAADFFISCLLARYSSSEEI